MLCNHRCAVGGRSRPDRVGRGGVEHVEERDGGRGDQDPEQLPRLPRPQTAAARGRDPGDVLQQPGDADAHLGQRRGASTTVTADGAADVGRVPRHHRPHPAPRRQPSR